MWTGASSFPARTSLFSSPHSTRDRAASSICAPARVASPSSRRARSPVHASTRATSRHPRSRSRPATWRATSCESACASSARMSSPRSTALTTSSSAIRRMWRRRRCASFRPSTGTSPAWRSPAEPTDSSSSRASSPARANALRRTGFWFARSAGTGRRSSGAFPRSSSNGRATRFSCWRAPEWRSSDETRPGALEAAEKRGFVGVEANEAPAHRDVVQLAERLLQRLQLGDEARAFLLRESRREELAAVAQPLHADAQRMALGRIAPIRLPHQLAMRALERRGAERGQALRRVARLERDAREARELLRVERAHRLVPRLGALAFHACDELGRGARGAQPLDEHVPIARAAERGRKLAQCVA